MRTRRLRRGQLVAALIAAAALVVPGVASAAPAVAVTQPATGVTSTSAVLHGFVSPAYPQSQYYFEYGTSTAYPERTPETPITTASNVSAAVHDLFPGITYHFRVVVVSTYLPAGDRANGADRTFTTPLSPGSVATTGDATSLKARSATLNGVVNTNDPNSVWFFQYGRTTAYDHSTAHHTVGASGLTFVSSRINNLKPNSIYHFRLVVEIPGQPPSDGQDKSFKTHKPSGHARLRSHHLRVNHGVVSIPWACSGPKGSRCRARVSLGARAGGGPLACASGKLNMSARHTRRMQVRLKPGCESALRKSRSQQLRATLKATFTTDQNPIRSRVTLNGT